MHARRKSFLPSIRRIAPVAGLGALLLAGPAAALDFNPIDFLPLTIHARTSCLDGTVSYPQGVFEGDLFHSDGETSASCYGAVVQHNIATQSSVEATCDAAADLEAGTLKVVAVGSSFVDNVQQLRVGTSAKAYLYDTLTVEGSWEGVRNVELQLAVDGAFLVSLSNELADDLQSSMVQGRLELLSENNARLEIADLRIEKSNGGAPFISDATASGGAAWATNAVDEEFDPADVRFTLSAVFPATPENRTFTFLGWLSVSSSMGYTGPSTTSAVGIADFGHTARFSLIAPADVTMTSSSGRFLTPAPSASGLGSAALATLAGLASRRARSRRDRPGAAPKGIRNELAPRRRPEGRSLREDRCRGTVGPLREASCHDAQGLPGKPCLCLRRGLLPIFGPPAVNLRPGLTGLRFGSSRRFRFLALSMPCLGHQPGRVRRRR